MMKQILFLKRNRIRKKSKLYKQVLLLSFDFTSLFYTLLVIGYIIVAVSLEGNLTVLIDEKMVQLEAFTMERFWLIVTIVPLAQVIRSFQQPGVIFSTAEYMLTILPHSTLHVWRLTAFERWLKALGTYFVGGAIIYLLSPTSFPLILTYVLLLVGMNVFMTIPGWKLFQQHVLVKIVILIGVIVVNVLSAMIQSPIIGIGFIVLLILLNIILAPKITDSIDWKKVTAVSDFKLWNMLLISRATRVKFKKERQYSIWQRMSFWKKPFSYRKTAVYHRLWHLYVEKNMSIIFQLIGALFVMLFVFIFVKDFLFLFAVAITIHSFTTFLSTLFNDRLQTDIVQVLPWDLLVFKRTFMKWAIGASVLFLLPLSVYSMKTFTIWTPVQWLVIIFSFVLILHVKLQKSISKWEKNNSNVNVAEAICYGLLFIIIFSTKIPFLLIVACFLMGVAPFFLRGKMKPTKP